jgi:hypothetical protein
LRDVQSEPESESAATVARGRELQKSNEWKAMSELDAALARVAWTDPLKLDAVQMRADWRGRVTSPLLRSRAGNECISIIDEAIVVQPSLALYALRARCARSAGRNDVLIESLWNLGNGTYNNARRLPPGPRQLARQSLETILTALDKNLPAVAEDRFDVARRDEVVQKLRAHIARLE